MKCSIFKKFFKKFTHNEFALYLLFGIAVINLLSYLQYNYFGGIIIFSIVALITSHFTKNMVIILSSTILITNLLVSLGFLSNLGVKEGLANSKPKKKKTNTDDDAIDLTKTRVVDIPTPKAKSKTPPQQPAPQQPAPQQPAPPPAPSSSAPSEVISGFKNFDEDDEETIAINQKSQKHNSAMKDVQNNLQQLLGGNGIQQLDTAELLKQQKQLVVAMKGMQPIIDGANGMIDRMGNSPIGRMLGISFNK